MCTVRICSVVPLSDPVSLSLSAALLNSGPREEAFSLIETWQLAGHIRAESGLSGGGRAGGPAHTEAASTAGDVRPPGPPVNVPPRGSS